MKRIVILSDTHGLLRPEVLDCLSQADAIIHGGDINTQAITVASRTCISSGAITIRSGRRICPTASRLPLRVSASFWFTTSGMCPRTCPT